MTFFLRIQDPTPLRKDILKSAKDVILVQYKAQKVQQLRTQRKRYKGEISELLGSLENKTNKLIEKLDAKDLDVEVDISPSVTFDESSKETQKTPEELDETDRLEYTLKRIEKTLSNLD